MHSFLSLGRLQLPIFGLFAAAGLMAAMILGLRTSRAAGVDRDAFWDAGMVVVFSAFLFSRALLVAQNLRIFLTYPVLVLELPSITVGGLVLTAVVAIAYLRRRRLALLRVLDAAAPGAALLAAFLEMGWTAEGRREGMPTSMPWAVDSAFGRVHPVEIYASIVWLALCIALLWMLSQRHRPGVTAACALALGGLAAFALDFFHLPSLPEGTAGIATWLDRVQWMALASMVAGSHMLAHFAGDAPPRDGRELGDAL
jgi:phosphatidylglycerol---prolipoprotein diacylglyceryl transferase